MTTKTKRMDLAFAALLSDDDEAVLSALTRIEQEGDARAIRPLLLSLSRAPEGRVPQRITRMLNEVKAPGADAVLLEALDDPELTTVRQTILSTFWNAGIDVKDHLDRFVTIALEGSAQECFECLTVIENQEIWPEKAARLGLGRVRKGLESEKDPYKRSILADLISVLEFRLGA